MNRLQKRVISFTIILMLYCLNVFSQNDIKVDTNVINSNTISTLFNNFQISKVDMDSTVLHDFKSDVLFDGFVFLIYVGTDLNGNVGYAKAIPLLPDNFSYKYERNIVDRIAESIEKTLLESQIVLKENEISADSLSQGYKDNLIEIYSENKEDSQTLVYKNNFHVFVCEIYDDKGLFDGLGKEIHVLRLPISIFEK
jgi:Rps23 Pro-64 3,4-dihydroxylase Tpa1-like proline 4-hydroxylase